VVLSKSTRTTLPLPLSGVFTTTVSRSF